MGFTSQTVTTFETSAPTVARATMDQNLTTNAYPIIAGRSYAISASWTGTPVGTIAFLGSVDGINFTVALPTVAAGGGVGSLVYDNSLSALQAIKVTYTFSSSTGTLSVIVNEK